MEPFELDQSGDPLEAASIRVARQSDGRVEVFVSLMTDNAASIFLSADEAKQVAQAILDRIGEE